MMPPRKTIVVTLVLGTLLLMCTVTRSVEVGGTGVVIPLRGAAISSLLRFTPKEHAVFFSSFQDQSPWTVTAQNLASLSSPNSARSVLGGQVDQVHLNAPSAKDESETYIPPAPSDAITSIPEPGTLPLIATGLLLITILFSKKALRPATQKRSALTALPPF